MARQFRYSLDRRVTNRVLYWMLMWGFGPISYYLLTVTGRRTGNPHSVPVAIVEEGDNRWLVAPYGEVDWVKNARVKMIVRLSRGNLSEDFKIRELPPDLSAPILKKYPVTRPYFDAREDSSIEEFMEEASSKSVFELIEANAGAVGGMKINGKKGDRDDQPHILE